MRVSTGERLAPTNFDSVSEFNQAIGVGNQELMCKEILDGCRKLIYTLEPRTLHHASESTKINNI